MLLPLRSIRCNNNFLPVIFLFIGLKIWTPFVVAQEIQMGSWFAPEMVLQRDQPIPVWGRAGPGQLVTAELFQIADLGDSMLISRAEVQAASDGRWELQLPPEPFTGNEFGYSLRVTTESDQKNITPVYLGDLWICSGQSNMNFLMRPNLPWSEGVLNWEQEVAEAGDDRLSVFTVIPNADWKPIEEVHGTWRPDQPSLVEYFSAVPYLFARELRREAEVPIGVIVAALGATSIKSWMPLSALEPISAAQGDIDLHASRRASNMEAVDQYYETAFPDYIRRSVQNHWQPTFAAAYPDPYPNWRHQPGGLYHGMLSPLERVPVKGVAWYQGATDSLQHATYREFLHALIHSWRENRMQSDLTFLVVQQANHDPILTGSDPAVFFNVRAALREAQASALELEQTALIVTADVGHPTNIHPRDKRTVAERLARAALHLTYGRDDVIHAGPVFMRLRQEGSKLGAEFELSGSGLIVDTGRATGSGADFEIAGADRNFVTADYTIDGNTVWASHPEVDAPVYLRYAYHNDPRLILFNEDGLPAPPFQTSLPMHALLNFRFNDSNLEPSFTGRSIGYASLTLGSGLTASGYNNTRGVPPPSFFVRSSSTPNSLDAAIEQSAYLEINWRSHPGYRIDFAVGGLSFDMARSTGLGNFNFSVRSDLDGFAESLLEVQLETGNEQFGNYFVVLPAAAEREEWRVRIYLWDDMDDSLRVMRFDNIQLTAWAEFLPQTRIQLKENSIGENEIVIQWNGAPGRKYLIYSTPNPENEADQWEFENAQPVSESGIGEFQISDPGSARFFQVGDPD